MDAAYLVLYCSICSQAEVFYFEDDFGIPFIDPAMIMGHIVLPLSARTCRRWKTLSAHNSFIHCRILLFTHHININDKSTCIYIY
jgi:hypothetical protein